MSELYRSRQQVVAAGPGFAGSPSMFLHNCGGFIELPSESELEPPHYPRSAAERKTGGMATIPRNFYLYKSCIYRKRDHYLVDDPD